MMTSLSRKRFIVAACHLPFKKHDTGFARNIYNEACLNYIHLRATFSFVHTKFPFPCNINKSRNYIIGLTSHALLSQLLPFTKYTWREN